MIIKRISHQDKDNLGEICSQLAPQKWGEDNDMAMYQPDALAEFTSDEKNLLVVGYEDKQIVCSALGYVLSHPDKSRSSLYLDEIDTHPNYRRKGHASSMLAWLRVYARENNLTEVWLATEAEDNVGANMFYKSLKPNELLLCNFYSYKAT